ncbi:unnamed protein product, partial [Ectocarpus sp. 12 AP-2014]
ELANLLQRKPRAVCARTSAKIAVERRAAVRTFGRTTSCLRPTRVLFCASLYGCLLVARYHFGCVCCLVGPASPCASSFCHRLYAVTWISASFIGACACFCSSWHYCCFSRNSGCPNPDPVPIKKEERMSGQEE